MNSRCWASGLRMVRCHQLLPQVIFATASLIAIATLFPTQAFAQAQSPVRSLEFIPRDALLVVHVHKDLFESDVLSSVRKLIPMPPLPLPNPPVDSVEELTFAVLASQRETAAVLKYRLNDQGVSALNKAIASGSFASKRLHDRDVFTSSNGTFAWLTPDTLLLTDSEKTLLRCLLTESASETLWAASWENSSAPAIAIANTSLLRGSAFLQWGTFGRDGPAVLPSVQKISNATNFLSVEISTAAELGVLLRTTSNTEDEASDAQSALMSISGTGRIAFSALREGIIETDGRMMFLRYIDIVDRAMERTRIEKRGNQLAARMTISSSALDSIRQSLPATVGLASTARKRYEAVNRMKQVGLALHNYESAYKRFPAAVQTMTNGVQRSWRATVSPFFGSSNVWNKYKQEQAWDSPANRALLAEIPQAFQAEDADAGQTDIFVLNGSGAIFHGGEYTSWGKITDGSSNTIWLVQLPKTVPWTKPEDVPFDIQRQLSFDIPKTGLIVATADGGVHQLPPDVDIDELKKAITSRGGEITSLFDD